MNALAIDKAIAKVPFLADSKNVKKIPLTGGITNLNFKIEADGRAYVIRLAGEGTDQLGIKRDVEHAANKAAGELGIAPEIMYFIEPEGYIVTRFVTGKRIMPEDIVKPDYLTRVAQKLRLFHRNGPKLKGTFNVFRRVEMLAKTAKAKGAHIDRSKHLVIESAHPSPFSAHSGFFGSKPFSKTNEYLERWNRKQIQW